ncbi:hypothetical protein [Actinomadura rudentiformis]|uniref:Uncharacterized protein n=1 Tax=Actinomadura rudentiformis TaxID=359158 RepID=A0A6H9YT10_9ACTN|nr:hypothetical protein [Actinomadura rudentiformis]KAB2350021.1 hypothetical protein F8566_09310 [Actinomadura rudentiformis]
MSRLTQAQRQARTRASVLASAIGLTGTNDRTEAAARIQDGVIVARAHGRGAAHAVATAHATRSQRAGT